MSLGMSANEYMAQFEILAGKTNFNEVALEDGNSQVSLLLFLIRSTHNQHSQLVINGGEYLNLLMILLIFFKKEKKKEKKRIFIYY